MENDISLRNRFLSGSVLLLILGMNSCAEKSEDTSRPTSTKRASMTQRLAESGGGYKQDAEGNWLPKSDKRSSYDSQEDSPYFKGQVEKETYKTGEYAKKSWWGSKNYETTEYSGNTDGSRFKKDARQNGQKANADGKKARLVGPYKTNTLEMNSAYESGAAAIDRPTSASVDAERGSYKAPSVIDWREQRDMSMEKSKGILGR